jgi:hypothetical protein
MKATDFYSSLGFPYDARKAGRYGFTSIKMLEFLNGRPWDDIALAYVHALRPDSIRVVRGEEKMNAHTWRVTVYVDADDKITGIRQEVEVWLPDGVENGFDLGSRVNHQDDD